MFDDAPYIILPAQSNSPVFVFCDHATNHVPANLNNLGLDDVDLCRHIAWDIGAETLTRQFCNTYGAAGLLAFGEEESQAVGGAGCTKKPRDGDRGGVDGSSFSAGHWLIKALIVYLCKSSSSR